MFWVCNSPVRAESLHNHRLCSLSVHLLIWTGTWDSLLQCCSACTWTHLSSSNKIQRNQMGLKITACICSQGKFWTKDTKTKKIQLPLLKSPEQKQGVGSKSRYCACPQHTTPAKGWANHLSHPSSWTPGHTVTLTPYKEQGYPRLRERASKEACCLFLLPSAAAEAPIKPCLNFLSGL